uniref:Tyrosinase copper-binding domain-containing protein n=1 Tax=Acrobeloides nanus TaxID=290746 RepID=A0A914CIK4_9BILA
MLGLFLVIFLCKNVVYGIMDCDEAPTEPMQKICLELEKKYAKPNVQEEHHQNHPPMAHSPDEKRQKYSSESQSYSSESQEENLNKQPHPAINQSPWLGQQPIVFQDDFPRRPIERIIWGQRNGNLESLQRMHGQMGQMGPIQLLPKGPVLPGYENVVKQMEGMNGDHPMAPPPQNPQNIQPDASHQVSSPGWDVDPQMGNTEEGNYTITKKLKGNYTSDAWMCKNLTCLCPYFDGEVDNTTNTCILPNGQPLKTAIRKEYRMLTDVERNQYHGAVKKLMENGLFDELSALHLHIAQGNLAHTGPNFWPWHRGYLKRFEIELRKLDPDLAIPYWDSTLDENLPNSRDSIMWTDDFIGRIDENGTVISGPGAHWITLSGKPLHRRAKFGGGLIHENDLKFVLGETQVNVVNKISMMDIKKKFHCAQQLEFLEIMHGDPHHYVGGDMEDLPTATNDPIFFMHHCFVDVIWELWRQQKDPVCHLPGLVDNDIDTTFTYAPRPTCSHENPDCGSKYLFCDRNRREARCAVKIVPGGLCQELDDRDGPCLDGSCNAGKCVKEFVKLNSKPSDSETLVPDQSVEEAREPEQQETLNLLNFATHLRRNLLSKDDYKLIDLKNGKIPDFAFA